jgi:hypothetical protein
MEMNRIHYTNLNTYFLEKLNSLNCNPTTKAYIVSIFSDLSPTNDLSTESITILYSKAQSKHDFDAYQRLANWIFLCNSLYPEHLNNASLDYYHTIGKLSYYSCYRLLNRQWVLFEQLADQFVPLSMETRKAIGKLY